MLAGTVSGGVTLALISDGGTGVSSIDGFGQISLAPETVTLTATIDNYATAQVVELSGSPTLVQNGTSYAPDLGTILQGSSSVAVTLGVENTASGNADALNGTLIHSGDTEIALSGVTTFAGIKAGQTDGGPTVTLNTGTAGVFAQMITLNAAGTNASGYLGDLAPETISVTGTVVPSSALCFCAGTQIMTPDGSVPIERLRIGDLVLTRTGEDRPLVWVGVGQVLATRGRRGPATPVIVRSGALADNVPYRDLRITKGHALFVDDVLIPVEFLVNHRSILWDDQAQEVTVYHIELETHDVLIADGAPAESYRDDGNRWLFQNANSGWGLPPQEPCTPVLTGGLLVDAIWRRLLERAGPRSSLPLTDDPDLHLLVDGKRIDALELRGDVHVFRLPARPRKVHICSRAGVPQELGLARDDRPLGVAIRRMVLAQARQQRAIEAEAESLSNGFHAFEIENGIRWTDGDAGVPSELFGGMTGPGMLMLHLGATTQYPDEGHVQLFRDSSDGRSATLADGRSDWLRVGLAQLSV